MNQLKSTSIMITLTKDQRDALKRVVANRNLQNLDTNMTVSGLCRQVLCEYLHNHGEMDYTASGNQDHSDTPSQLSGVSQPITSLEELCREEPDDMHGSEVTDDGN